MAMVKVCNDYFMIDALAGGQVIRKRKYRRENTMIGYNGMIIMGSRFPTPQKYLVLMDWLLSINV